MGYTVLIDGGRPAPRLYGWRRRTACVVAVLSLALVHGAAAQSSETSRAEARLSAAQRAVATNINLLGAYRDLQALVDGPMLRDFDADRQHEALLVAATLAARLERPAEANALLRRSCEYERATWLDWSARFRTSVQIEDHDDAVFALKELAARWPERVATLAPAMIYPALRDMRRASRADAAVEALELLFAGRWLAEAGQEPSPAWRDLALARLERNDLAGAAEVAARIVLPIVLIEMRVDKRFDALVAASPARFDIAHAVDEELESLRRAVAATPNELEPLVRLIIALETAGRLDEGLALADGALERAANPNRVSPYTDGRDQVVWLRNARADILWTMGRHSESADELKKASDVPGNVSQRINYASRLVRLGRGAEALPLVRELEGTSPYGAMQAASVAVAAASQVGDRRAAARALDYLEKHEADAIGALQNGYMSVRDFESAARVFIKRLESTETRGDALLAAQDYLNAPAPTTPYAKQRSADFAALLERADVRAALDEVGRVESHPIHAP